MNKAKTLPLLAGFALAMVTFTGCDDVISGVSSAVDSVATSATLLEQMYLDEVGFNHFVKQIQSDFPTLTDVSKIEFAEIHYSGSATHHSVSSILSATFVRGDNPDRLNSYVLLSEGMFTKSNVDFTVGERGKEKLQNEHKAFEPMLFTGADFSWPTVISVVNQSFELYKKDTGVSDPFCDSVTIERDNKGQLTMRVSVGQQTPSGGISRKYTWTADGTKQLD